MITSLSAIVVRPAIGNVHEEGSRRRCLVIRRSRLCDAVHGLSPLLVLPVLCRRVFERGPGKQEAVQMDQRETRDDARTRITPDMTGQHCHKTFFRHWTADDLSGPVNGYGELGQHRVKISHPCYVVVLLCNT